MLCAPAAALGRTGFGLPAAYALPIISAANLQAAAITAHVSMVGTMAAQHAPFAATTADSTGSKQVHLSECQQ